jgi:hypothetical protein
MGVEGKVERPSSRSRLPGISAKFDAVSAGKLWNFAVGKEMAHLSEPRTGAEGTRRLTGPDGTLYVKYNTYVEVDRKPGERMQRFQGPPPPSEARTPSPGTSAQKAPRKDWEEKYRFFSRPYNVERQNVQGFENYRMRKLFDTREQARQDPVIDHSEILLDDVDLKAVDQDYAETLTRAIDHLQAVRDERGQEAQFAGVKWHKYKYFSGGFNYPNTGCVNRFLANDIPRPPSFVRGTAPVPAIRPSLIKDMYYGK